MQLFIKNMVCQRCILAVKSGAEKLGIRYADISLGQMKFHETEPDAQDMEKLKSALCGFRHVVIMSVLTAKKPGK